MSAYVDTTFVYTVVRSRRDDDLRDAWIATTDEQRPLNWSPLVVDEIGYRLALAFLRDDGETDPLTRFREDPLPSMRRVTDRLRDVWARLDTFGFGLLVTDEAVVEGAKTLMADPGLAPRDAFHAAHALSAGCEVIVSTDTDYDAVPGLTRLGPPR